jgi:hypothetical protein
MSIYIPFLSKFDKTLGSFTLENSFLWHYVIDKLIILKLKEFQILGLNIYCDTSGRYWNLIIILSWVRSLQVVAYEKLIFVRRSQSLKWILVKLKKSASTIAQKTPLIFLKNINIILWIIISSSTFSIISISNLQLKFTVLFL